MLFELHEINKTSALIQILEQQKQKTYEKLVNSYSKKDKTKNSLNTNIQNLLQQSALLIHIFRQVEESVKLKNLFPHIFNSKDLNKLIYSAINLPQWFQHVFQKEYQKYKITLETIGIKIYKLNGLYQKNAQLVKQHWNLEIIFKRYQSLNEKQLQNINILDQISCFQALCKECKQILKIFLDQMVKKLLQFLQHTVQSTLIYSQQLKNKKSPSIEQLSQRNYVFVQLNNLNWGKISDLDSRNTVVDRKAFELGDLNRSEYGLLDLNETIQKDKGISTLERLKMQQRENNNYFYRQSYNLGKYSMQNSKSKTDLTSCKSDSNNFYKTDRQNPVLNENIINFEQNNNTTRSRNKQTKTLQRYKSTQNVYTNKQPLRQNNYQKSKQKQKQAILLGNIKSQKSIKSRSKYEFRNQDQFKTQCYHHCSHHDKLLNNHCSKHCSSHCSHQKTYHTNFGLDLPAMNKRFEQNKNQSSYNNQNYDILSNKALHTYRSETSISNQKLNTLADNKNIYQGRKII